VQLAEVANRRDAAEIESGVARAPLYAGWKIGQHEDNSWRPVRRGGTGASEQATTFTVLNLAG
jgi:hypothetical protein